MGRLLRVVLFLLVVSTRVNTVYSQEAVTEQVVASVSGEIVSVDVEKSTIVVKQLKDEATKTYEDVTITVAPETTITEGEASLKLADLKAGSNIKIESTKDAEGKELVKSIAVEKK